MSRHLWFGWFLRVCTYTQMQSCTEPLRVVGIVVCGQVCFMICSLAVHHVFRYFFSSMFRPALLFNNPSPLSPRGARFILTLAFNRLAARHWGLRGDVRLLLRGSRPCQPLRKCELFFLVFLESASCCMDQNEQTQLRQVLDFWGGKDGLVFIAKKATRTTMKGVTRLHQNTCPPTILGGEGGSLFSF